MKETHDMLEKEESLTLQSTIDFYFDGCLKAKKAATISGLSYAVGFDKKEDLLNYSGRHDRIIKRALLRLEIELEERLFSQDLDAASFVILSCCTDFCKKRGSENAQLRGMDLSAQLLNKSE